MRKTTFTKKAMAFLLALVMIISGITVPQSNVKIVNAAENVETSESVPVAEEAEGIVGTTDDPANAEARIGDAYFTTFAQAVSAARDASSNVTVTLLKDVTVSSGTQIASKSKKTITYDGDGKQRTITTSIKNAMTVGNTGSKVIFQNIKLTHTTEQATLYMSQSATLELKNVDILVKDITNYQYGLISLFGTTDNDTTNVKEDMTLNMEDVTITMDNVGVKTTNSENNALIRTGNGGDTNDKTVRFNMKNCTLDASTSSGVHAILTPSTTDCYAVMEDCTFSTYDTIPLQLNGPVKSMDKTRCSVSIETTNNLRHYNASNKKELFTATYTAEGAVPVAQVGKTLYADLASAVAAAGEGKIVELLSDVTLGTQANSTSGTDATARTGQITIGTGITIDGNQHKITTYAKHSIKVNYAGAVALRNIEFDCYQQQSLIQVSKAAQLTASDLKININSTTTTYYQYGIIAVPATGTGIELNLTRVNVDMTTGGYGADAHAVVRTGNNSDAAKSMAINVTDCNWDLTGADDRIGIMIMKTTTATIVLDNSKIQTLNAVPIYVHAESTGTTIEKKNGTQLGSNNLAAQIGNKGYTSVAEAVEDANASASNVTIDLLKNSTVSSQVNLMNDNSVVTTFEGNGYTLTTSGTSGNAFVVYGTLDGEGTYEFKNMNVVHGRPGVLVQLNTKDVKETNEETGETTTTTYTSKKAIVKFTNVDITNANNGGYMYGLITTLPTGSDADMRVDFDNVDVTLTFDSDELSTNNGAVIRTGNENAKSVTINLKDSNIDLQNAAKMRGILVTKSSDAVITLEDSNIITKTVASIEAAASAGDGDVTMVGECSLTSLNEEFNTAPIKGYDAQIGNKVYRIFATAIAEAEAGATVEVLQNLSTGWRDITKSMTIDGNGYEITSTAGDANNKFLFVVKGEATEFKLKDLNIKHLRRGMVVRTDIPTTVTLENVHIDATQAPVSTEYALFNLTAEGTTNLIWNNVTVDMDATEAGLDGNAAIIRTGNADAKTVNITLTDCDLNTEGAAGRHGIVIMPETTATLNLTRTNITTLDVLPIKDNTGSATINKTDCDMNYTGIEAVIGNTLYTTFADAVAAANASEEDVTIEIMKDITVSSQVTLRNDNSVVTTFEGNGNKVTTTGESGNAFVIQGTPDGTGTYEFKNMDIDHGRPGVLIQLNQRDVESTNEETGEKVKTTTHTSKKAIVKLTNVNITNNNNGGYLYGLITTLPSGNDADMRLDLEKVNVTLTFDSEELNTNGGAIIRTGNENAKFVTINLTECNFDVQNAAKIRGIYVTKSSNAVVTLTDSDIITRDIAPIEGVTSTVEGKVTLVDECNLTSLNEEIAAAPIVGYEAKVGNTYYSYFGTALSEAEDGATVELLKNITTGWRNITKSVTIEGNGYTISSNEGTASDKHTFAIKDDATEVTFKNVDLVQKRRGMLFRTDIATTLTLENVHIDATQAPVSTEYALVQLMGEDVTTNLIWNNVTVDMDATEAGLDSYPAIIRTGNADDKDVNITLINCNLDATGATGRHGIVIIDKTVANIELIGTTITTMDAAPIMDYSRTAEVTKDENSTISCVGEYEAYVNHTVYATFAEALEAANKANGIVTLGLLKNVTVGQDISIGNTKGKIYVEGNDYTITTAGGECNNAFRVNQKAEVEFRNMTMVHKNFGSLIQVTKAGAVLTLTNVFVDAKYAAENSVGTYNYTLINLNVSSTLNMTNVDVIMEVENLGGGGGKQSALIRTGNKDDSDKTYKDIEINLVDCILDATKATDRSGILVVDADLQLNLKGNTQILTQDSNYAAAIRGLEGTKKAIISMEETCLLRSGESSEYDVVVKNLDTSGIADTCTWTYKKYNNVTAFRTKDGLLAPTTVPTGYVFAGWYTDKTCTTEYALAATDITTTSAYAKFVPDHVIDVKAQLSANLLDGVEGKEKGAIRFVTTVDSTDYNRVGFEFKIELNNRVIQSGTLQSKELYRELSAIGDNEIINYIPETEFCAESQYFKAITIKGIPQYAFDADITVKPFWVTLDGTKVYGDEVTKTINEGLQAADENGNIADPEVEETVYTNRVVLVSDLHYTTSQEKAAYDRENWSINALLKGKLPNASWAAGDAFGYTQEEKLQAAITDINALGAKEKIDSVMVLGDLTLDDYGFRNLVKNYLADFKTNFMDELDYPTYAIAGNHDSYTNTEWKNVIGTDRQYSVVIGDAVFVMLDTFEDKHATSASGSSYKGVDIAFLTAELQKEEYAGKNIFLCAHNYEEGKYPENDAALKNVIANDSRIVGMFDAHTHVNNVTNPDSLAGAPLVNIGGYAYGGGIKIGDDTEFGVFNKSWAWGYQVIEWNESEVHIYHMKSARTYTDYLGNVHNYKGAIEGDMVIKLNK